MEHKVEALDITHFLVLVSNMLEWNAFDVRKRRNIFEDLISSNNVIVEACETDPSLKIEVA